MSYTSSLSDEVSVGSQNSTTTWGWIIAIVVIVIVAFIAWKIVKTRGPTETFTPYHTMGNMSSDATINPRNFELSAAAPSDGLPVKNYLPRSHLRVLFHSEDDHTRKVLIDSIPPLGTSYLSKFQVEAYLKPGYMLSFQIRCSADPKEPWTKYADYRLNKDFPADARIRALHVGQITTRFMGTTDVFRATVLFANAQGGLPWVKIHNVTDVPLSLNMAEIIVPPHSVTRYQGYLNMGVPLGSWFRDDDSRYPEFQYLQPQSDLYYGLISDLPQPVQGCWQMEFSDECSYGQTLWPFEEGIIR